MLINVCNFSFFFHSSISWRTKINSLSSSLTHCDCFVLQYVLAIFLTGSYYLNKFSAYLACWFFLLLFPIKRGGNEVCHEAWQDEECWWFDCLSHSLLFLVQQMWPVLLKAHLLLAGPDLRPRHVVTCSGPGLIPHHWLELVSFWLLRCTGNVKLVYRPSRDWGYSPVWVNSLFCFCDPILDKKRFPQ